MKKFVMLMLVLGMASLATAGLQLSFNGDYETVDSEVYLTPSDTAWIDIYNDTATTGAIPGMYVGLSGLGSWTGGNNVYTPPSPVDGTNTYYGVIDFGLGEMDVWAWAPGVSTDGYGVGAIADYEMHCDGEPGDVTISLISGSLEVMDTMVIHQIPEPMTMVLLGLGGLFLRRRK